eukprot:TRINITY_DN10199_c0_g1_i8.p1 TRINITY_DN10199_c0_g1~~TRINITY_DN10199_c0_g1_i8.p1  ORF type:complete len:601 (+),score=123.62 TRINITY_DN10199_c0_g1_i8:49-1851(+)
MASHEAQLVDLNGLFSFEDPQQLLDQVEAMALSLQIRLGDRSYQTDFTENYRELFTSTPRRLYRGDILEACRTCADHMMVNGISHSISVVTLQSAVSLRASLAVVLDFFQTPRSRGVIKSRLQTFDAAWVVFERNYVHDLMRIEAEAREPVITAIALEHELTSLEMKAASHEQRWHSGNPELPISAPREVQRQEHSRAESSAATGAESPCRRLRQLSDVGSPCRKQRQQSVAESASSSLGFGGSSSLGFSRQRQPSGAESNTIRSLDFQSLSLSQGQEEKSASGSSDTTSGTFKNNIHRLALSATSTSIRNRDCRASLEKLVCQMSMLNSLANVQGHGRDDMSVHVLEAAANIFLSCQEADETKGSATTGLKRASATARLLLALRVLKSFAELRSYFSEIGDSIMKIDPQLSNNTVLVQRLADWEEAWELGSEFLLEHDLLESFCGIVARAAEAQRSEPDLQSLIENQDAELFLVLPRLIVLWGLAEPGLSCLMERFLPHHFGKEEHADGLSQEMSSLIKEFGHVSKTLGRSNSFRDEVLVKRAVAGAGQACAVDDATGSVDRFMLLLEGFSMDLQRRKPEDWNRCCAILLLCVEAASAV